MVVMALEGERALFARPEFRNDQISYDFITPHAAVAMLRGIHDPAPLHWVVETIRVVTPLNRECIEERGRRLIVLRDVQYIIEAYLKGDGAGAPGLVDPNHILERSMRYPMSVHLGRPRFPGRAWLMEPDSAGSTETAYIDHGWMLHSIAFAGDRRPRFFHAQSIGGVVRVPPGDSPLLFA